MKYWTILYALEIDCVHCVLKRGDRNRRKFDFQTFVFNGGFSPMVAAMALFTQESLWARDCAVSYSLKDMAGICERCFAVISIRTGICDLLAFTKTNLIIKLVRTLKLKLHQLCVPQSSGSFWINL